MKRAIAVVIVLALSMAGAHAFGMGKLGGIFGKEGGSSKRGVFVPQPTGKILLADGVSHLLLADGVSRLCRAGGC